MIKELKITGNSFDDVQVELIEHLQSHKRLLKMIDILSEQMAELKKRIEMLESKIKS